MNEEKKIEELEKSIQTYKKLFELCAKENTELKQKLNETTEKCDKLRKNRVPLYIYEHSINIASSIIASIICGFGFRDAGFPKSILSALVFFIAGIVLYFIFQKIIDGVIDLTLPERLAPQGTLLAPYAIIVITYLFLLSGAWKYWNH